MNRSVLHYLKLWDGVVFGKKMREKAPVEKPKWQSFEDWQKYQRFQEPDYDEKGFPFKKVSLCELTCDHVPIRFHNQCHVSLVHTTCSLFL